MRLSESVYNRLMDHLFKYYAYPRHELEARILELKWQMVMSEQGGDI